VLFYLIDHRAGDPVDPDLAGRRADVRPAGLTVHWATSGFGAQLTWTLPFGLLIMFAVFNRFDKATRKPPATRAPPLADACATWCCRSSRRSLIGVALFGFTLSYDEFARTLLTAGSYNTLPLEIYGMTTNVTTPVLYALGTLTTAFSLLVIGGFHRSRVLC
jgi:putative spermidine/putrescine transport system permease protein